MQKFIEQDYYELDWCYDDCADGNKALCWRFGIVRLLCNACCSVITMDCKTAHHL